MQKFFALQFLCYKNCTFIFDSKEAIHADINVQNFMTQKNVEAKFVAKNTCKNKSSKIFDDLVRVHNDQGLKIIQAGRYRQGIKLELQEESFKQYGSYNKVLACL